MTLTRFSDYALRVLMFAAVRCERTFSVDEVACAYNLSRNHLAKVINRLVQTGHLKARRGRGGGVWLGCDPKSVRLGAVVRLTESGSPLVECFETHSNRCCLTPACRLKSALQGAVNAFYESLDEHTLADLVDHRDALEALLRNAS